MRIVIAFILILLAMSGIGTASRADEVRSIVILDATAQMSANLGQKRKLDWAKAALGDAARRMEPGRALAVWAFGTSPEKKCADSVELLPLQAAGGSIRSLNKALSALQPKAARAPVMETLQKALQSPALSDGKPVAATLIAGTGDDCSRDLCAAATGLHGLYPNARLTVLGLSMSEQAAASLTCAAKAMGGSFTAIKSGTELERTLREALGAGDPTSRTKAFADEDQSDKSGTEDNAPPEADAAPPPVTAEAPASTDQPEKGLDEKKVQPPQPEPNVVLSATLAQGLPSLEEGVTWEIYKTQVTPTGQIKLTDDAVWVGGGAQARARLPEGRYGVKVAYGLATGSGEFTLGPDRIEKTFTLDAGTLVAEALEAPNGRPLGDAFFAIFRQRPSSVREELARSSGAPALFQLNAGDYVLQAFANGASIEAPVKVLAGKVSVVRMALNVGTLEIKAFAKNGPSEAVDAWHRISPLVPPSPSGTQSANPALRVSGSSLRLQLPAGNYRIESVYGNAHAENTVTIRPGEATSQTVILNAGEAQISLDPGKADRVCSVFEAGADRKAGPVARAAGSDIRLILNAGRYAVECSGKGDDASPVKTEINVVAGEVRTAKIDD